MRMLSWRFRFLFLSLIFGSVVIRDVTGRRRSLNGMHKISASDIFAKTVMLQLAHNSDFVSVLSRPMNDDLLSNIGSAISEALVEEFKKPDLVLVTAYVNNSLQKVSEGSDAEKYAKALMNMVSQILVGYKILNWKNIFKIADTVMDDILQAVYKFKLTTPSPTTTTESLDLDPTATTPEEDNLTDPPETSLDEANVTPTMIPEQMDAPEMFGSTPEIKSVCPFETIAKASRNIPQKPMASAKNVITINMIDLINVFKKDLTKRLQKDRYFRNVFSDYMSPSSLNTLSSAIAHFLAKAFKLPRTTLLPLENNMINLVAKGTSSPDIYAEKISKDLGLILRTSKIISPCVLKIQVSMAEKAILSAIENFVKTSRVSGFGMCMNGNLYSSHFSVLNGLDMLPYVGPNAVSPKFSPIKKAAKALEQSTKFSQALYVNLISCSRFNEQFLLGVPKSSFKLIANTLGNFMAEAFGTCGTTYFAEEYSKALLSNQVALSYKTYAKIISIATTKVLYSLGYFVSGSPVLQAAIAANAVIKALSPRRASAIRDYAKVMNVPWGTPIVGARPIDLWDGGSKIKKEDFGMLTPIERKKSVGGKKTSKNKNSKKSKRIRGKREISEEDIFASYNSFPIEDTDYNEDNYDLYFSEDDHYMDFESVNDNYMIDFDAPDDDEDGLNDKNNNLKADKAKFDTKASGKTGKGTKGKGKNKAKSGVRAGKEVKNILDILPKLLANKLYSSTALYTSVSLVGISKVIDLFSQAIAVHFGYDPAAYFIDMYNKDLGGKANSRVKAKGIEAGVESIIGSGARNAGQGSSGGNNGTKKEEPKSGEDYDEIETFVCPSVTIYAKSKKSGIAKMAIIPEEVQVITLKIEDENAGGGITDSGVTTETEKSVTVPSLVSEEIYDGGEKLGVLQTSELVGIETENFGEELGSGDLGSGAFGWKMDDEDFSGGILSIYDENDDDDDDDDDDDEDDGDEMEFGSGDGEGYIDGEDFLPPNSFTNKRAGFVSNNIESDFELCIPALAKAITEALKVSGILNTNFSLLTADQLAVALVAKLSSLIATSLDAKGLDNDLTFPYNLNRDMVNPSLNYGWSDKANYDASYNSYRKAERKALENDYRMYSSRNRNYLYGSEYYDGLLL